MRFYPSLFAMSLLCGAAFAQEPAQSTTPDHQVKADGVVHKTIQDTIQVNRFVLATAVHNREPQDVKTEFTGADQTVFAFLDLKVHEPKTITLHWKRNGHTHRTQKLHIKPSARFRTWACVKTLSGNWNVSVEDEHGKSIQELSFVIGGDAKTQSVPHDSVTQKAGLKKVLTSLEPEKAP
jgi:hypothetical protein